MNKQLLIKDLKSLLLRTLGIFIILGSLSTIFTGFNLFMLLIILIASFLFNVFLDIILSIVRMHFR